MLDRRSRCSLTCSFTLLKIRIVYVYFLKWRPHKYLAIFFVEILVDSNTSFIWVFEKIDQWFQKPHHTAFFMICWNLFVYFLNIVSNLNCYLKCTKSLIDEHLLAKNIVMPMLKSTLVATKIIFSVYLMIWQILSRYKKNNILMLHCVWNCNFYPTILAIF